MSRGRSSSSMAVRTTALTILARIIAKNILRKSVAGYVDPEIITMTPDKGPNGDIGNRNDVNRWS